MPDQSPPPNAQRVLCTLGLALAVKGCNRCTPTAPLAHAAFSISPAFTDLTSKILPMEFAPSIPYHSAAQNTTGMPPGSDQDHRSLKLSRLRTPTDGNVLYAPPHRGCGGRSALRGDVAAAGHPRWAIWTVVVISPPARGDILRKTTARLVGTPIGCIVAVILAGLFPQDRVGMCLGWAFGSGYAAISRQFRAGMSPMGPRWLDLPARSLPVIP